MFLLLVRNSSGLFRAPALAMVWCLHSWDTEADPTDPGWIPSPPTPSRVAEAQRKVWRVLGAAHTAASRGITCPGSKSVQ